MNIEKYLDENNLVSGNECLIYKVSKEEFKAAGDDDLIYIGDGGLEDLEYIKMRCIDLTDKEIIDKYIGASKNSIRKDLHYYGYSDDEIDSRNLIEYIFDYCDWMYVSTAIESMEEMDEEYE